MNRELFLTIIFSTLESNINEFQNEIVIHLFKLLPVKHKNIFIVLDGRPPIDSLDGVEINIFPITLIITIY